MVAARNRNIATYENHLSSSEVQLRKFTHNVRDNSLSQKAKKAYFWNFKDTELDASGY